MDVTPDKQVCLESWLLADWIPFELVHFCLPASVVLAEAQQLERLKKLQELHRALKALEHLKKYNQVIPVKPPPSHNKCCLARLNVTLALPRP